MKRLLYIFLFLIALFATYSLAVFSNPTPTDPACFIQGESGAVEDLSKLCGTPGSTKSAPQAAPTAQPASQAETSGKKQSFTYPKHWKVYPDGSISPGPGILVPSLYDIN